MKVAKLLCLTLPAICSTNFSTIRVFNYSKDYTSNVKGRINGFFSQNWGYGSGGSSTTTEDTLVTSKDLVADVSYSTDSKDSSNGVRYPNLQCGNLYVGKVFCSEGWFVGWIGRHTDVKIAKITKHVGVYATLTKYVSHDFLEADEYSYRYTNESDYYDSQTLSLSFDFEICGSTEKSIGANLSIFGIDANSSVSQKSGAFFTSTSTYTRTNLTKILSSESLSFTKKSAQYCPRNYYAAIGLAGTWYEIEGEYQTVMQYWFAPHSELNDWKPFKATYATPNEYPIQYVYKDSNGHKYHKK